MNYLFDLSWYASAVGLDFASLDDAVAHYNMLPIVDRQSPSPYFDKDFYLRANPDVAEDGIDPFAHFVEHGEFEDRSPHPLIDLKWYRRRYDVQADAPLRHYLATGWTKGEQTHPSFFATWYARKSGVRSEPLLHYLLEFECQFDPNPLFSDSDYRRQVSIAPGVKPLVHYLTAGHLAKPTFCDVFDYDFFDAQCAKWSHDSPFADALTKYLVSPTEVNPHPLFDRSYVRRQMKAFEDGNELAIFLEDATHRYILIRCSRANTTC